MNDVAQSHAAGADNASGRRLSFAFAKRHGVISARQLDEGIELWVRPGVKASVLAEVQRMRGETPYIATPIVVPKVAPASEATRESLMPPSPSIAGSPAVSAARSTPTT